ncbi:MAG: DNA adenine methylase [Clostridia bacterium]
MFGARKETYTLHFHLYDKIVHLNSMSPRSPRILAPLGVSFNQALGAIANEQKPLSLSIPSKPFVKWVGGKRSIMDELMARIPKEYYGYYEPFIGGGALFFSLQPENAHLSDVNLHLILAYRAVRDDVEGLIGHLKVHEAKHNKTYFLKARKRISTASDPVEIASLFIYLNKTCFNGLYRVNKSGEFNVPLGDYKDPSIVDEVTLRADVTALNGTEIHQRAFSQVKIEKGAFYYLDPPYHETYDGYNGSGFGVDKHIELAEFCKKIDKAGGKFMLSNSDTDLVQTLYKGYTIEQINASRSVSCKANQRGKEAELLIRNYADPSPRSPIRNEGE